jgi:2-polyprenyl-6-methoxyphenol hydroxylase-like FAD-dependent oxidoreductase
MADVGRILIVGGGIGGLSVATALHRAGLTAELVERSTTWPAIGSGINLPANGVRALRALGIGEAFGRAAAVVGRWGFFDQRARLLCETDLEALWGKVGPCLAMTRVKLQEALLGGAAAVTHRLGVSLTALAQDAGRVRVGFSDGTTGSYELVVGADGIHSTVRRLAIGPSSPTYAGQTVWRSLISTRPPGIADNIMVLLGDGCFFGIVPMGDGWSYGFGAVDASRFQDPPAGRLERLRSRFGGFGEPVPTYLAALEDDEQLHAGPIEWVEPDAWYRGRVVLVGDAVHAGPPHMGEGGCMAVEDALVLAEVLGTADTIESALESYVRRRRPRVEWVQEQSRAAAQAWVLPPSVRDALLRERGDQTFRARYRPLIPEP